ncbi:Mechanosensitive ion channel [Pseudoloma neurophilia]|uniref:Mechanosensitive ion channel n=1 Tax=Pseudoloma neurophilia TaxID=146866 RepID=A0A0R0LWV2_9MICR|nr:Mechanosensitive ion channel [Pseudoloma neurophilia]
MADKDKKFGKEKDQNKPSKAEKDEKKTENVKENKNLKILVSDEEDPRDNEQNAKEEIIQEFIAPMEQEESIEDETQADGEGEHRPTMRKFKKMQMMRKKVFSIGNMDEYLHYRYRNYDKNLRLIIEMLIVVFMFMFFPTILLIWKKPEGFTVRDITNLSNKGAILGYYRETMFFSLTYVIFIASTIMMDYNLYVFASTLSSFDIKIEGFVADFLEVLKLYSYYMRNFFAASCIFIVANVLIAPYKFKASSITPTHLFLTFIFWFACLSAILFIEKCVVNFLTSEMKKSSFRNRIWDANFKTFVFKKLAAIAEAVPRGESEKQKAISSVSNEFDPGYFLRHNDLDLNSEQKAADIAESIFAYLGIEKIDYKKIEEFYGERADEIMTYLGNSSKSPEEIVINYDILKSRAIELYRERKAISQSLEDRDSIIRKLDNILLCGVFFLSFIGFLLLLNVDYKFYLASIGPFLFAFSWIFQDNIKDLYKCFVFHLLSHPYDVGDRVIIENEEFVVEKIDLLYTTFLDNNNKVSYMPNTTLVLKKIENIRRTKNQCEAVEVKIPASTKYSKLDEIHKNLEKNCSKNDIIFTGHAFIREIVQEDDKLKLILSIEHRGNFQDLGEMQKRRIRCIELVQESLSKSGVSYDKSMNFLS